MLWNGLQWMPMAGNRWQSLSLPPMTIGFFSSPFWGSFVIHRVFSLTLRSAQALHYTILHMGIDCSNVCQTIDNHSHNELAIQSQRESIAK